MEGIFRKIEELQRKPIAARKRIAYAATAVLSGLVFLFWLSIFPGTLDRIESRQSGEEAASPLSSLQRSFAEFSEQFSEVAEGFRNETTYAREESSEARRILEEGMRDAEEKPLSEEGGTATATSPEKP